ANYPYRFAIPRVNQRRVVIHLDATRPNEHGWQVVLKLIAEDDLGAIFHVEVDVALQMDWASEPLAFGDDHATAALFGACLDRFREGFGIFRRAAFHSPEISNTHFVVRELRTLELRHVKGRFDRRDRLTASVRGARGNGG